MKTTPTHTTTNFQFTTTTTAQIRRIAPKPSPLEFDYPFKKVVKWFAWNRWHRAKLLLAYVCIALFLWATWHISKDFKF
jgi:hypothetical protein